MLVRSSVFAALGHRARVILLGGVIAMAALPACSQPAPAAAQTAQPAVQDWTPPAPEGHRFRSSFTEAFDTLSLWNGQSGVWTTSFGYDGIANRTLPTNGELQIYTDRTFTGTGRQALGLDPFEVNNGVLDIIATRVSDDQSRRMWNYRYASGLLTTRNSHTQTYGYFEIRAKLPAGKGLWPAFWLLPEDGSWPPEIDILEQLGREPHRVYVGYHANPNGERDGGTVPVEMGETQTFHRYGMLWTRETLTWFIDGVQQHQVRTPADMHKPMYMLVNMAIGGNWAQAPDPFTRFPARMSVDYVRAYALEPQAAAR